jgi:hypothetical protein
MTDRPDPTNGRPMSGRAPRYSGSDEFFAPFDPPIDGELLRALAVTVHVQNLRGTPDVGPKSRFLSRIAADLELALIERRPKEVIDRLCLDVAATALRLLEQGDGHE